MAKHHHVTSGCHFGRTSPCSTGYNTARKSMSCSSRPISCERLSSDGVRPPLGKCKKQNNRQTEGVRKRLLVLSCCFWRGPLWKARTDSSWRLTQELCNVSGSPDRTRRANIMSNQSQQLCWSSVNSVAELMATKSTGINHRDLSLSVLLSNERQLWQWHTCLSQESADEQTRGN